MLLNLNLIKRGELEKKLRLKEELKEVKMDYLAIIKEVQILKMRKVRMIQEQ